MLKKLAILGAMSIIAVVAPIGQTTSLASPVIFENMSGKWRGKGLVKASPKGKQESIRCRMSNKPDGSSRIKLSGNCAVSGFVFSLNGFIEQNGGKNSYTASMFRSLANLKQSNFSGKRSGTRINFSFKARDRVSKQNVEAKINLNSKNEKAFDVQISRTDPASGKVFKVGTITFAKR
ncbi:MAG: hypothetical protein QNJ29_08620 [Rhizobiaceae bacterium]|nr:hypothetical protein [Rhizobiaceae bacterium]